MQRLAGAARGGRDLRFGISVDPRDEGHGLEERLADHGMLAVAIDDRALAQGARGFGVEVQRTQRSAARPRVRSS